MVRDDHTPLPALPHHSRAQQSFAPGAGAMMLVIEVPITTVSEANRREHWGAKARRVRHQRTVTRWCCRATPDFAAIRDWVRAGGHATVVLTRLAPRSLDTDNLAGALKAVRDAVADELGLPNDRDPRIEWRVMQIHGRTAARITVWTEKEEQ